jgi:hypothetical protein
MHLSFEKGQKPEARSRNPESFCLFVLILVFGSFWLNDDYNISIAIV